MSSVVDKVTEEVTETIEKYFPALDKHGKEEIWYLMQELNIYNDWVKEELGYASELYASLMDA